MAFSVSEGQPGAATAQREPEDTRGPPGRWLLWQKPKAPKVQRRLEPVVGVDCVAGAPGDGVRTLLTALCGSGTSLRPEAMDKDQGEVGGEDVTARVMGSFVANP